MLQRLQVFLAAYADVAAVVVVVVFDVVGVFGAALENVREEAEGLDAPVAGQLLLQWR